MHKSNRIVDLTLLCLAKASGAIRRLGYPKRQQDIHSIPQSIANIIMINKQKTKPLHRRSFPIRRSLLYPPAPFANPSRGFKSKMVFVQVDTGIASFLAMALEIYCGPSPEASGRPR